MKNPPQNGRSHLRVVLPRAAALALSGALLAISDESEELLLAEVGVLGPELEEAFDLIIDSKSSPDGSMTIDLPIRFEPAFRKAIAASISLLDESEAETLTGKTRSERAAAQEVVVECLDRAIAELA